MVKLLERVRFGLDHRWTPGHLSAHLEGELGPRSRARVRRHVAECSDCRHGLITLGRMLDVLPTLAPIAREPAPDIAASVLRRLRVTP